MISNGSEIEKLKVEHIRYRIDFNHTDLQYKIMTIFIQESDIHAHDVKCGRGHGSNRHEGNQFYRAKVHERKQDYKNQTSNFGKTLIAKEIVRIVHFRSPPGRFIEQDGKTNRWIVVSDEEAEKKVKQALREKENVKDLQYNEAVASHVPVTNQPLAPMPPLDQPRRISMTSSRASLPVSMMGSFYSHVFELSASNSQHFDPHYLRSNNPPSSVYSQSGYTSVSGTVMNDSQSLRPLATHSYGKEDATNTTSKLSAASSKTTQDEISFNSSDIKQLLSCFDDNRKGASDMSVTSNTSLTLGDLGPEPCLSNTNSNHNSINMNNENSGKLGNIFMVDATNAPMACSESFNESSLSFGDPFLKTLDSISGD